MSASLLSALDAFAFGAAAPPVRAEGPARAGAEVEPEAERQAEVEAAESGASEGARGEDAALRAALEAAGDGGPKNWRRQLEAVLGVGARGTVEGFHEFLLDLVRDDRPEPRFLALCAAMLSAQTRDSATLAAVRQLAATFGQGGRVPRLHPAAVAVAPLEALEESLRGVNFHKTKAKSLRGLAAALLRDHEGLVPRGFTELVALPGVGPKVANLVRSVAFGEVEDCGMVVDTHVHRLARRLGWTDEADTDPEHTRRKLEAFVPPAVRELVTRRLIGFGQEVCLPRRPRCESCPLAAAHLCPSAATARRGGEGEKKLVDIDAEAPMQMPPRRFERLVASPEQRGVKRLIELE